MHAPTAATPARYLCRRSATTVDRRPNTRSREHRLSPSPVRPDLPRARRDAHVPPVRAVRGGRPRRRPLRVGVGGPVSDQIVVIWGHHSLRPARSSISRLDSANLRGVHQRRLVIRRHVTELMDVGVVREREFEPGERLRDYPYTFYELTARRVPCSTGSDCSRGRRGNASTRPSKKRRASAISRRCRAPTRSRLPKKRKRPLLRLQAEQASVTIEKVPGSDLPTRAKPNSKGRSSGTSGIYRSKSLVRVVNEADDSVKSCPSRVASSNSCGT